MLMTEKNTLTRGTPIAVLQQKCDLNKGHAQSHASLAEHCDNKTVIRTISFTPKTVLKLHSTPLGRLVLAGQERVTVQECGRVYRTQSLIQPIVWYLVLTIISVFLFILFAKNRPILFLVYSTYPNNFRFSYFECMPATLNLISQ